VRDGDYFFLAATSTITLKSNSCYLCLIESRQTVRALSTILTFAHILALFYRSDFQIESMASYKIWRRIIGIIRTFISFASTRMSCAGFRATTAEVLSRLKLLARSRPFTRTSFMTSTATRMGKLLTLLLMHAVWQLLRHGELLQNQIVPTAKLDPFHLNSVFLFICKNQLCNWGDLSYVTPFFPLFEGPCCSRRRIEWALKARTDVRRSFVTSEVHRTDIFLKQISCDMNAK